jgi:hypothetical protein
VQPLFEHRLDVAGYDTRVLELLLPFPAAVHA